MGSLRNREGARSGPRAEAMNPAPCHGSTRIEFRENTNVMNLHRLHWFPDTQTIRLRKLLEPVSREMPHPPRSPRPPAVPPLRHGAELQRAPAPARDQGRVRVAVATREPPMVDPSLLGEADARTRFAQFIRVVREPGRMYIRMAPGLRSPACAGPVPGSSRDSPGLR